ncbi:MAG: hypothetical protein ABIC40_00340, partial [bacterium]
MIVISEIWGQDRNFANVILEALNASPGEIDSCPHISLNGGIGKNLEIGCGDKVDKIREST